MGHLKEVQICTDREIVMARLARKLGRGHDPIFHGTRNRPSVLRSGKLLPSIGGDEAVFLSRSPEVAAYWAAMLAKEIDQFVGGVLVLNRTSLVQSYRLDPSRYATDWQDEREERIFGRAVNFRRHLLGVVREIDIEAILGPPRHRYLPADFYGWSDRRKSAFFKNERKAGEMLVSSGKAAVREIIVDERSAAVGR
jgi:hypothetical protein